MLTETGADKSDCPTPGASDFSDWASKNLVETCPWASDFLTFAYVLKMKVPYFAEYNAIIYNNDINDKTHFFQKNSLQSKGD